MSHHVSKAPLLWALAVGGALALTALPSTSARAQKAGGEVVVAQSSNPPSLDAMATSSAASRNITMNV